MCVTRLRQSHIKTLVLNENGNKTNCQRNIRVSIGNKADEKNGSEIGKKNTEHTIHYNFVGMI